MAKTRKSKRPEEDKEREDRIIMEIVVDAYDEQERAMGWYYYLDDKIAFPFTAICDAEREMSPLSVGERVEVTGMAHEETCQAEIFVKVRYGGGKKQTLAVPLMQLAPTDDVDDDDTREAVEDWRYWAGRGYRFG